MNLHNLSQEQLIALIEQQKNEIKKLSQPQEPPQFMVNGEWDNDKQQIKLLIDFNDGLIEYLRMVGHTGTTDDEIFYKFIIGMLIEMAKQEIQSNMTEGKPNESEFS